MVILYVLKGKTGKRYVGITNNLSRRLQEHRSKTSKGGQLLGDFFVLHTEEFPDYKTARNREKFLKSGQGRKWLDEFECGTWPALGW
jgi:putative endonuclease